jgi:hypothetical protein
VQQWHEKIKDLGIADKKKKTKRISIGVVWTRTGSGEHDYSCCVKTE